MRSNPTLYQLDVRAWLHPITQQKGSPATLDDVPEAELLRFARIGFDWLWIMGVWQTGEIGRSISAGHAEWRQSFHETLVDFAESDITGSTFAVRGYSVSAQFGGPKALARLRERLKKLGIRLMLDFVPNHTAIDHPWAQEHPSYYVAGTEESITRQPQNFTRVKTALGQQILAYGRDPYFDGWPDTLQLNYGNPELQNAMIGQIRNIAAQCDGIRCDMAMLALPDVFERTWGIACDAFWPRAIAAAREVSPHFLFMAEVYWGREWDLQQLGFDYTYDKDLYDRLVHQNTEAVRGQLHADLPFQSKSAHFLENHDEPRAAHTFPKPVHMAAALLTYLIPGLRFFHDGQLEGACLRPSVHLCRRPLEEADPDLADFYNHLLELLKDPVFQGSFRLLDTSSQALICIEWAGGGDRMIIAVNYSPNPAEAYLPLPGISLDKPLRGSKTFLGISEIKLHSAGPIIKGPTYRGPGAEVASSALAVLVKLDGWDYLVLQIDGTA